MWVITSKESLDKRNSLCTIIETLFLQNKHLSNCKCLFYFHNHCESIRIDLNHAYVTIREIAVGVILLVSDRSGISSRFGPKELASY